MNILENIIEIAGPVNPIELIVSVFGLSIFAFWLLKTSFGTRALENSIPRRNNMPLFMPFALILIIFLAMAIIFALTEKHFNNSQNWRHVFLSKLFNCITGLISIGIILYFVRKYFVRGLKGFGLNIKTFPRDFAAAFINLAAIWPLMMIVIIAIMLFNQFIYGPEYEIPTHVELQSISANQNLPIRIAISVMAIGITPVLEELLFRGLFQTTIRSAINFKHTAWIAILITTVFFVVNHADLSHWPLLFILGACMGYSYEKSGSLFRPILIHVLFNASSVISIWLQ